MKSTKADYQEKYTISKNYLQALEAAHDTMNGQCIIKMNVKNADGTIPQKIYEIEDDETFEKIISMAEKISDRSGLWDQIIKARQRMNEAEFDLIQYALSIVPAELRVSLELPAQQHYMLKQTLLNLALRYDGRIAAN